MEEINLCLYVATFCLSLSFGNSIVVKTSFTFDEKVAVLRKHNEYRRALEGTNVHQLFWHYGLEKLAQGWADNCEWKHNPDKSKAKTGIEFAYVAENIYLGTFFDSPTRGIEQWYNEQANIFPGNLSCKTGTVCGHYTQIVWHDTTSVACALRYCDPITGSSVTNVAYYVVCNYGPGGNTPGQTFYNKGTLCSECSQGTLCIDKLCAPANCNGITCEHGSLVQDVCMCNCTGSGYTGEKCETGGSDGGEGDEGTDSRAHTVMGQSLQHIFAITWMYCFIVLNYRFHY